MSPWTYTASGSSPAIRSPASFERTELITTPAPAPASRLATASPIPLADPVTIAALPVRSIGISPSSRDSRSMGTVVRRVVDDRWRRQSDCAGSSVQVGDELDR